MATTKVFQSGNSRAVRLPKEFSLPLGEVDISQRGDEVVLRPKHNAGAEIVELLCSLSGAFDERPRDDPPQERDWL